MIKAINEYFLGDEEEISLSDKIWFYGQHIFFGLMILFVVAINVM